MCPYVLTVPMLSELPDSVLSLSLDLTVSTAGLGLKPLSLSMTGTLPTRAVTARLAGLALLGSGNLKCCPGPDCLTVQGGVVSGCEVTITWGLLGELLLQLLELESKGAGWTGGGRRGRLGLPSFVMCSKKKSRI